MIIPVTAILCSSLRHSSRYLYETWWLTVRRDRFLSAENASTQRLAYIDSTTNRAIIKVDNTSFVPWNFKRNSVRISTRDAYGVGTVFVVDLWHAPYGVSGSLHFLLVKIYIYML